MPKQAHKQTTTAHQANHSLGFGVGLRTCHFAWLEKHLLPHESGVDWFEAITENFLDHHGYARHMLFKLREHYPIALHGVSLSIGSSDPLDKHYLQKLKQLATDLEPALISDHLCWTSIHNINSHDLLPMPLTQESLQHVTSRVHQVQDILQRPLVLENPSTYCRFQHNDYSESEFLQRLVQKTDCQLLIDVNNIYVSSVNLGFDTSEYLSHLPLDAIVQCHLAGATDLGSHLIDTHDQAVIPAVWQLYADLQAACKRTISTLLEWDANIPHFTALVTELNIAKHVLQGDMPQPISTSHHNISNTQQHVTNSALSTQTTAYLAIPSKETTNPLPVEEL